MNMGIGKATQGMNFFVERQCSSPDGKGGPQQLRSSVSCEIGPIDNNQWLACAAEYALRDHPIQFETLGGKMAITEQAVDALDAVLDVRRTDERTSQFAERQPTAAYGSPDRSNNHSHA